MQIFKILKNKIFDPNRPQNYYFIIIENKNLYILIDKYIYIYI